MTDEKKRKGAPRRSFADLEIELLVDEYKQIPDDLLMAVDRGFGEVLKALVKTSFFSCGGVLSSRDCLNDELHKKLQAFSKVIEHRKAWYARLQVIKSKDPKRLNVLERQALKLSEMEGREAYIQLQKALKACIEADENKAKEVELARRLENKAKSLEKQASRGTSETAERRARTTRLCFHGSLLEAFCGFVEAEPNYKSFGSPIVLLKAIAEKGMKLSPSTKRQIDELLESAKNDRRNPDNA